MVSNHRVQLPSSARHAFSQWRLPDWVRWFPLSALDLTISYGSHVVVHWRVHGKTPGWGGITHVKWTPLLVKQSPTLSPPEIAGLATLQFMSVMPESCTVQWTLWFPLVPEHSTNVRNSVVGDGVAVFVAAACVAGVVSRPLWDIVFEPAVHEPRPAPAPIVEAHCTPYNWRIFTSSLTYLFLIRICWYLPVNTCIHHA